MVLKFGDFIFENNNLSIFDIVKSIGAIQMKNHDSGFTFWWKGFFFDIRLYDLKITIILIEPHKDFWIEVIDVPSKSDSNDMIYYLTELIDDLKRGKNIENYDESVDEILELFGKGWKQAKLKEMNPGLDEFGLFESNRNKNIEEFRENIKQKIRDIGGIQIKNLPNKFSFTFWWNGFFFQAKKRLNSMTFFLKDPEKNRVFGNDSYDFKKDERDLKEVLTDIIENLENYHIHMHPNVDINQSLQTFKRGWEMAKLKDSSSDLDNLGLFD